jgi:hypothetical protein
MVDKETAREMTLRHIRRQVELLQRFRELTTTGERTLVVGMKDAQHHGATEEEIAEATGFPLDRVRQMLLED